MALPNDLWHVPARARGVGVDLIERISFVIISVVALVEVTPALVFRGACPEFGRCFRQAARLQFSFTKKLSRRCISAEKGRVLPASAATTLARCAMVGATLERLNLPVHLLTWSSARL